MLLPFNALDLGIKPVIRFLYKNQYLYNNLSVFVCGRKNNKYCIVPFTSTPQILGSEYVYLQEFELDIIEDVIFKDTATPRAFSYYCPIVEIGTGTGSNFNLLAVLRVGYAGGQASPSNSPVFTTAFNVEVNPAMTGTVSTASLTKVKIDSVTTKSNPLHSVGGTLNIMGATTGTELLLYSYINANCYINIGKLTFDTAGVATILFSFSTCTKQTITTGNYFLAPIFTVPQVLMGSLYLELIGAPATSSISNVTPILVNLPI